MTDVQIDNNPSLIINCDCLHVSLEMSKKSPNYGLVHPLRVLHHRKIAVPF